MPLLAASLALLATAALAANPPPCKGKVTGATERSFACEAIVLPREDGVPVFMITSKDVLADVPAWKPGAFELPSPPAAGTYTLDTLGMGMASLAIDGGALYTATKTSSQRGEVTIVLERVTPHPTRKGAFVVHGSYRARLVPAGHGRPGQGEIVYEVTF